MSNYRRVIIPGGYFFTVVTYRRSPFLTSDLARKTLHETLHQVGTEYPFSMAAICLMPDHLHCVWQMPAGDADYSTRWSIIKRLFAQRYTAAGGMPMSQTNSRCKKSELGIWQRRFWEHRIRDEADFWNHVHYTHFNPVKHGLVARVEDWPYSTYHKLYSQGVYSNFDWSPFDSDSDSSKEAIE